MIDFDTIYTSMPALLSGAKLTILLSGLSLAVGLGIAIPAAYMRLAKSRFFRWPAHAFIFYFRGTPLLVQIFLIYNGPPQFKQALSAIYPFMLLLKPMEWVLDPIAPEFLAGLMQSGWWMAMAKYHLYKVFLSGEFCAVLALTLNTAAYTAEILRGAIQAVPYGEIEAAKACGMSGLKLQRRIILPKAFRIAWPAYTNEVVFLLQASSLVYAISVADLTFQASVIAARTLDVYEIWITTALMYLAMVYCVIFVFRKIEYAISGHLRERRSLTAPLLRDQEMT